MKHNSSSPWPLLIFILRVQLCFELRGDISNSLVEHQLTVGNIVAFNIILWLWGYKVIETIVLALLSDFEARFEF